MPLLLPDEKLYALAAVMYGTDRCVFPALEHRFDLLGECLVAGLRHDDNHSVYVIQSGRSGIGAVGVIDGPKHFARHLYRGISFAARIFLIQLHEAVRLSVGEQWAAAEGRQYQ